MNMEEQNMDKAIREKLERFSQQPPLHVWDNIQGQLQAQKRKHRIVFFSRIAAAAVVLLAFMAGWYFNEKSGQITPVVTQNEIQNTNRNIQNENAKSNSDSGKIDPNAFNENNIAGTESKSQTKHIEKETDHESIVPKEETADFIADAKIHQKLSGEESSESETKEVAHLDLLDKIETLFKTSEDRNLKLKEKSIPVNRISEADEVLIAENIRNLNESGGEESKWKLGLQVSPGYSSQNSNYSENYSNSMTYSGQNGNANVTGGISVQMKAGKKWSVESGVYYSQNGQRSTNSEAFNSNSLMYAADYAPLGGERKSYFNTAVNLSNGQIEMNSTAGTIQFSSAPAGTEVGSELDGDEFSPSPASPNTLLTEGEFSQVFDFIEIPLYLRYSLVDAKFGVELLGGVNAGIIAGNKVYMENQYGNENIGKTKDISSVNISGTVGVGLNYALNKNISLAVEPRFNYYLNSINQNPDVSFRPYRIGVYTGLYYEF
ncbi:outer membrane beta-barrel protein [Maribellus maritimus]|uniref:outer membrane beta-barrel protein n=1 Tax=Maribellus maritimus TaxID=2870838 RepID=UPI001EEC7F69|nr:outer membrane beta-barrel protein [Maribellus maritimus]MCG6186053.1 PorT family protein [Maribellus maritimus]